MSGFPSLQFCLPNRVKDVLEEEVVLNSHEALCHSPPFPFSFQCRLHVGGNNLPQITQGLLPFDHAGDLCARVKSMYPDSPWTRSAPEHNAQIPPTTLRDVTPDPAHVFLCLLASSPGARLRDRTSNALRKCDASSLEYAPAQKRVNID